MKNVSADGAWPEFTKVYVRFIIFPPCHNVSKFLQEFLWRSSEICRNVMWKLSKILQALLLESHFSKSLIKNQFAKTISRSESWLTHGISIFILFTLFISRMTHNLSTLTACQFSYSLRFMKNLHNFLARGSVPFKHSKLLYSHNSSILQLAASNFFSSSSQVFI